jgi:hypothetical protein
LFKPTKVGIIIDGNVGLIVIELRRR